MRRMLLTIIRQFSIAAVAILSIFPSAFAQARERSPDQSTQSATGQWMPHLPAVRLEGNYFSRDGHRFIPVGANWVPAKAAMQWPTQWDPKAIEADFARMHEQIGRASCRERV